MSTANTDPIIQAMRGHYLFDLLPQPQLLDLAARTKRIGLAAGERLFSHDESAEFFFLVAEGRIKLFRTTIEGQEKVIDVMAPGRSFAEAVMFMHQQCYPAHAEALSAAVVYAIPSRPYLALLRENPEICFRLLGSLSMRLQQRLNEIETLSLQNAGYRLARYLLQRLPNDAGDGAIIELPTTKQVIAAQLAITPETLSRLLRTMTDAGIIEVRRGAIVVRDVRALAAVS